MTSFVVILMIVFWLGFFSGTLYYRLCVILRANAALQKAEEEEYQRQCEERAKDRQKVMEKWKQIFPLKEAQVPCYLAPTIAPKKAQRLENCEIIASLLKDKTELVNSGHCGPYCVYLGKNYETRLNFPYFEGLSNRSLLDRILDIVGVEVCWLGAPIGDDQVALDIHRSGDSHGCRFLRGSEVEQAEGAPAASAPMRPVSAGQEVSHTQDATDWEG